MMTSEIAKVASPTAGLPPSNVTDKMRTDTLADSVLILLALTAVQRLVGFVRSVLFCRWLDAGELGQWDMAFGFLVLAGPLVVLALPGAFGRYVEQYRQRKQLRTFLRRTLAFCGGVSLIAAVLIWLGRRWFSVLIFGTPEHSGLVALLSLTILAVVAFNFSTELFTALRNVRLVSGLQFLNSLAFAALGIALVLGWRSAAESVVLAYGGACLLSAAIAGGYLAKSWPALPEEPAPLTHRDLWTKLMPLAGWIWTMSLLANLFTLADRYMIVHWSAPTAGDPLAIVGQYHSSRVVPLLLVSVATMLGSIITPHLSCDWENGYRRRVSRRLNLFIKSLAFALTCAAVLILAAAPLLFGAAFRGKFDAGLAVLPWTLVYCIWFSVSMVAQNYLWCAEKAGLASWALLIGLCVNISLNAVLLPKMGLAGAVAATTIANAVVLLSVFRFAHLLGFQTDLGTWIILAAPVALGLGPWPALAVLGGLAVVATTSDRIFSPEERQLLVGSAMQYLDKLRKTKLAIQRAVSNRS